MSTKDKSQNYRKEFYDKFDKKSFKSDENLLDQKINILNDYINHLKPKTLYRYRSINVNNLKSLITNQIWLASPNQFNDPYDTLFYYNEKTIDVIDLDEKLSSLRNNIRIACFSETNNNMLMWSHYADSHKGFVLEYAFSEVVIPIYLDRKENTHDAILYPIYYTNEKFDITSAISNISEKKTQILNATKTMLCKSTDWEYENEWRITNVSNFKADQKAYADMKPIAIYFGCLMKDDDKKLIYDLMMAMKNEIKFYEMKLGEGSSHSLNHELYSGTV